MAIRVLFDSTEINSNYIVGLKQSVNPYGEYFKIGNTICRQFTLDVLNDGFSTIPNKVYLYDNQTIYATLNIDNVDTEHTKVTSFTLVDTMVMFNQDLTYTVGQTVKQILESVCATFGITLATQSFYMSDLAITWTDELTIRDFISYVAEVNGGYAYINASGNLVIESYSPTAQATINLVDCSSIKIGSKHLYDRVYVELAAATKYYPQTSSNDTLYLNPNNILFTDSGSYTIDATIQHIQSVINGLTFYNINIEKCPIQNVRTGQIIRVNNNGTYTPFICTIDTTYNAKWNGGYNVEIGTSKQEETQVSSNVDNKIHRLKVIVDRDAGRIDQILSDASGHTGSFSMYLNESDPNAVVSCINASADNIVLNTKSLIFGEYPNGQYIEVKNYVNESLEKIGVLFDGTGDIYMQPEGKWDVSNFEQNVMYNQIQLLHTTTEGDGNVIYLGNNDLYGTKVNHIKMGAHNNYNSTYGHCNYIAQQNNNFANTSITANYINMISTSDDAEHTTTPSSNKLFIFNKQYTLNNTANSLSMNYTESQSSCNLYNYKINDSLYANYITMSSTGTQTTCGIRNASLTSNNMANQVYLYSTQTNNVLNIVNNLISTPNRQANKIEITAYTSYNKVRLDNGLVDGSKTANFIEMYTSTSNSMILDNNNYGTNYYANRIEMKSDSNRDSLYIYNYAKSTTANQQYGNVITMESGEVSASSERVIHITNYDNSSVSSISNRIRMYKQETSNYIELTCFSANNERGKIRVSALDDNYWKISDRSSSYTHDLIIETRDYNGSIKDGIVLNGHRLHFTSGYVTYS